MSEDKKQASQRNKALVKKEDQEQFIQEKFTEDEVKELLQEGFTKDQIAWVAKEKIQADKQCRIIGRIVEILTWIFPFPRG